MVQRFVEECHFLSYPTEPKQFEISEGIIFTDGMFNGKRIKKLAIFPAIIYVDGSDTDEAHEALLDLLEWGRRELGLNYSDSTIRRWAYVSNVVIQSDISLLLNINPVLNEIGQAVSDLVRINLREDLVFQPSKLYIGIDPQKRSGEPAAFSIQHRGLSLFEERCYFCEAPIPTQDHLRLLEKFEASLQKA